MNYLVPPLKALPVQDGTLQITDPNFEATKDLPNPWIRKDEWYNFKDTHWDSVNILITIDESTYTGGENGNYHPLSWYRNFEGGRSFYTALGHTKVSYSDSLFLRHILGGILWTMGK